MTLTWHRNDNDLRNAVIGELHHPPNINSTRIGDDGNPA